MSETNTVLLGWLVWFVLILLALRLIAGLRALLRMARGRRARHGD